MTKKYPFFKNGTVYIDETIKVTDLTAQLWKMQGNKKIITLTHGTDHIQSSFLPFENKPGINTDSTAQWCIKKMLDWAYAKKIPIEISNKKILVIGLGQIGRKIEEMLLYWGRYEKHDSIDVSWFREQEPFEKAFESKIKQAEIIFLCINPEKNNGFFDEKKLGWMKKEAILISPSRESVFSPAALLDKRIILDKKHEAWKTIESIERKQKEII